MAARVGVSACSFDRQAEISDADGGRRRSGRGYADEGVRTPVEGYADGGGGVPAEGYADEGVRTPVEGMRTRVSALR